MAARGVMPPGLVASTLPETNGETDGEPADDQGRGSPLRRSRSRRRRIAEKGRSRNLVIPDSIYDRLYLYSRKRKVNVSTAACDVLDRGLPKLRIVEDE
jgi:hypothetical protein